MLLEQVVLNSSLIALLLSIVTLIMSMVKVGVKSAFSLKGRLTKISISFFGMYAVLFILFVVLVH
jgi:hypothetical protein